MYTLKRRTQFIKNFVERQFYVYEDPFGSVVQGLRSQTTYVKLFSFTL